MIESLNANLTFDPVKDFTGVAKMAVVAGILLVSRKPAQRASRS